MKNLLNILFALLLLPMGLKGQQNLVPNGSFEYYTSCPSAGSQIDSCIGWTKWNQGSPDYFNVCATSSLVSVPSNIHSYQYPHEGNAYMGGAFNMHTQYQNGLAEYIKRSIMPLTKGGTYEVSFSINLIKNTSYSHNGFGVFLYKDGPTSQNTSISILQRPQIDYSFYSPITDTQNWTRLTQIYTSDSAYEHIVIGGFNNVNNLQIVTLSGSYNPYFFFDSIVIKYIGKSDIDYKDTLLCASDSINVSVRINDTSFFLNNNIFSLQLSDRYGNFTNPTNIGSKSSKNINSITGYIPASISNGTGYRTRLISSSPADTSENNGFNIKIANPDSSSISITNNSPLCEGGVVNFSASTNVSSTTYAWTGPNGFNSTSTTPSIGGASPVHNGNYYATLKFYGCEVNDTIAVNVKPLPAKPVANNNSPVCAGATLNLTASSTTTGVGWNWAGPGSYSSTTQNTNISNSTTAMSGDYIVTADLNGCNRKDTTTVLVKPLPTPVTLSNNTPLCAGDTLKIFSTTSSGGVTYNWAGPGSFSSLAEDTVVANTTAAATGWYKMTVGLNGCIFKDSTYATIYPIPATPVASHVNPLCIGETLNLSTGNVTGATYSWTGANSFNSSQQNPIRANMQFGDTGTYSVTVTVNGCVSPQGNATVKINPTPFVVILANPADSICKGAPVVFTALPNNHGGTPAYQWFVNGVAAGTGIAFNTSTLNNGDIIRCDMTENTKCSVPYKDESNDIQMNVLPWLAPTVSISANPAHPLDAYEYVTFTAVTTNAGNNPKYQWKRNGQNIVGATGSVWSANTLNDNDSISVEIISNYKCPLPATATSNWIKVKMTGVGDIDNSNGIILYPNPARNQLFISRISDGTVIELYDVVGRKCAIAELLNTPTSWGQGVSKGNVSIDVRGLASGVYIVKISGEGVQYIQRFVKE